MELRVVAVVMFVTNSVIAVTTSLKIVCAFVTETVSVSRHHLKAKFRYLVLDTDSLGLNSLFSNHQRTPSPHQL